MKTKVLFSAVVLSAAVMFSSCSKDDNPSTPEEVVTPPKVISEYIKQDVKTGVYQVTNLPMIPTGAKYVQDGVTQHAMNKPFYFNFSTAQMVTEDKAAGLTWDMVLMDANTYFNAAGLLNNGTINNRPWSQNGSTNIATYVTEDFDNVKNIPSDLNFTLKAIGVQSTGTLRVSEWGKTMNTETGIFSYYLPIKNITYIIKLNDGKIVKLCMQNMYKVNDVSKPYEASATSTSGFLTFKYAVFPAGTTDINTVK